MARLLAVLAASLMLAACGAEVANGSAGAPDDPVSAPATQNAHQTSRAQLREPEEGLVDVYARAFDRHRADGRKVTLFYYSGPDECYGLDRIRIRERARKVVLTIFEGRHPEAEVCTEIAVSVKSVATLDRPLGNRKVVDGASD